MATSSGIVGLDVKATQTYFNPLLALILHFPDLLHAFHLPQQHDGTKILKPIGAECRDGHSCHHGISVSFFDFEIKLGAKVREKSGRDGGGSGEGEQGGDCYAVTEGDFARDYGMWYSRIVRRRVRRVAGDSVDGRSCGIFQHGRHGCVR